MIESIRNMKITFVILHYETTDDTRQCLESLIKYLIHKDVNIILVDNGSTNGKIDKIQEEYLHNERMHFIYSEKNLGFAKGNNLGFRYAKEVLGSEIIVLCNNDLIFRQNDFIEILEKLYREKNFDIAGPKIISLADNMNQNPIPVLYKNIYELDKRILKYLILFCTSSFNFDLLIHQRFGREIKRCSKIENGQDFQLHGACLIFANNYIKLFDGLYDQTFMYEEESILKYFAKKELLNMEYADELTVYHKEGSATEKVLGKGRENRRFYYKWNLNSCLLLRSLMKGSRNNKK